ncbi:hypothetical protein PR048_006419 [Dryococelus australis]|uniref:DUF4219 domain-containing protein n=1 Tax=Dryococelus australis TaxID=614101 RepID=A0ABQ9IB17_9NEOP|nr:hypothetical protein PR048_006419 [Dryococelus australis]
MSGYQLPPTEKLKGRENFDMWKFAVQTYLEHEELWDSVTHADSDKKKDVKARSKIILLVDPINHVHAFQDTGLTRRVGLFGILITTRKENSESVEDYSVMNGLAGLPDVYEPMVMRLESSGTLVTGGSMQTCKTYQS